ncbi:MAG: hypothetical protein M2R45_02218 [Verrucomicrobia subdivision 3 bacterium]|nr:hypothetical protein [Limisphaerales bacterium]MCS1413997.1 hypothetical protein [Limisphaerales bacterium]
MTKFNAQKMSELRRTQNTLKNRAEPNSQAVNHF